MENGSLLLPSSHVGSLGQPAPEERKHMLNKPTELATERSGTRLDQMLDSSDESLEAANSRPFDELDGTSWSRRFQVSLQSELSSFSTKNRNGDSVVPIVAEKDESQSRLPGCCGRKPSLSQCMCPPWLQRILLPLYKRFGYCLTFIFYFCIVYLVIYSIEPTQAMLPRCRVVGAHDEYAVHCVEGEMLTILVYYSCAFLLGEIMERLRLPGLLGKSAFDCPVMVPGMLVAGLFVRLTGELLDSRHIYRELHKTDKMAVPLASDFNVTSTLTRLKALCMTQPHLAAKLRQFALATILTRAGFSLDLQALLKGATSVCRLAFMPCMTEAMAVMVASKLLIGWSWSWGALLGFTLAAVSPAVIVPNMLRLELSGRGIDKGIPTLLIAASSLDDVAAIMGFSVSLSIAISTGTSIGKTIGMGVGQALLGLTVGAFNGLLFWLIPLPGMEHSHLVRVAITIMSAAIFVLGSEVADLHAGGALACLAFSISVASGWRLGFPWRFVTRHKSVFEKSPKRGHSFGGRWLRPVVNRFSACKRPESKYASSKNLEDHVPLGSLSVVDETTAKTTQMAQAVLPPNARTSMLRCIHSHSTFFPNQAFSYKPIRPQRRRFSIPEPSAPYDSETFSKPCTPENLLPDNQSHAATSRRQSSLLEEFVDKDSRLGLAMAESGKLPQITETEDENDEDEDVLVTPQDRGMACLKSIRVTYAALWWMLQPMLFGLIGGDVNVMELGKSNIGMGVVALIIGIIFRMAGTVLAMTPSNLLLKERIFVAFAWVPKATVQAALGSAPLDLARSLDQPDPQFIDWGQKVLSLAVLSILIAAPLGAILIPLTAPCMLKDAQEEVCIEDETQNEPS